MELRDAAEILPESRIIRHKTGSVALFANWFRYELQRRGLGTWTMCASKYRTKALAWMPRL